MNRVFVCGLGSVSPAGWTVEALRDALAKNEPLPTQPLTRPGWQTPLQMRPVPNPAVRPSFLAHPRLRRTSPITHYAAAAALEAVKSVQQGTEVHCRIGIIVCLQSGCVQFSFRFFQEALQDAATASPLLFPETVFAAPASHVAALLEKTPLVCTLAGDPSSYSQGLALGIDWLLEGRVDACLVLGAEEINWLLADALWHFDHRAVISGGAGALCLSLNPEWSSGVELELITDAHPYTALMNRKLAAIKMRAQMPPENQAEILCDGLNESPRADAAEANAWADWRGPRISPKLVLGEGLMAAAAWQCVAACDLIARGKFMAANVSLVGANQQAIGIRFQSVAQTISDLSLRANTGSLAL
jgi:3-oxoacyl-(acyl-carrier-protein) synthase